MTSTLPAAPARAALLTPPGWLVALTDGERVAAELDRLLPGPAAGGAPPPRRVTCALLDLRARGADWKVRYRVVVDPGSPGAVDVVLAGRARPPAAGPAGPAGPAGSADVAGRSTGEPGTVGWAVTVPALGLELGGEPVDRRLPAAAVLLDPAGARLLLEGGLGAEHPGLVLAGCLPTAVRYLYGSRCTVVYRLDYPDAVAAARGGWPATVVAKAHADGVGARVDAAMRTLWATSLADGDVVRLARPLGHLPAAGVLLQSTVPGTRTLRDVLAGAAAGDDPRLAAGVLRRVADGLAALHACGVTDGPGRDWADDLDRARRAVARVAPAWPDAERVLTPLLDALADRAGAAPPSPARPTHGAFRPSQVLVDGDRVGFLDLDGFCLAEAERDVARFTKSIAKALLLPAGASAPAHARARALSRSFVATFVARYVTRAPLSPQRLALWEALDVVAGLAQGVATLRPGVEPLLRMLDDAFDAVQVGDAGPVGGRPATGRVAG